MLALEYLPTTLKEEMGVAHGMVDFIVKVPFATYKSQTVNGKGSTDSFEAF